MIFRITDYVHYGTLDNRERGTVRLTLQLMGMPHPVNITLQGDCLQDLAGCVVDFRNPSPQTLPAELTQIPEHIQGVAGDMTASRRMPVKGRKTMENALYLEWFTSHGRIADTQDIDATVHKFFRNPVDGSIALGTPFRPASGP